MKKLLLLLSILIMVFSIAGCNNAKPTNKSNEDPTGTPVNSDTKTGDKVESSFKKLSDVENYFIEKGLVTGEKTLVEASMIGALNGFKYVDSDVEVYEYDLDSEQYKGLVENNTVEVEGFGMEIIASAINGKYVLFCENAENKEEIINNFKELK